MTGVRRVQVRIRGRVQGVFFRASCVERARALGVGGWVRNAFDGSVEAEFEGVSEAVESMIAWCQEGPPGAQVDSVEVRDKPPTGERTFRVAR
ncbi:MAG TPA: acylphosphatase [Actinomycetota bacterium]|nr:acylphosphatase [Actinomycetota bacterium]